MPLGIGLMPHQYRSLQSATLPLQGFFCLVASQRRSVGALPPSPLFFF